MFSRTILVRSLMQPLRSFSTFNHPGMTSLRPHYYRHSYRISRLHTSRFTNNNSPVYQSHKRFGFTIRENGESLDKSRPVVVILGWNNSQDKYLTKYSELFEKRGYDTLCSTANPFNTFFRSGSKVKQIGRHILDVLLEMNCSSRPVFLYAFSNGGGAVFFHLSEALTLPESKYYGKIKIAGTIFDSFPVLAEMKNLPIVQKTVTGYIGNPIIRGIVWYSLGISIPLLIAFHPTAKRFMHVLNTSPLKCDQLLLFSKTDAFAPYKDIKDYINVRKKRGVHVHAKCWDKSEHVNHFREHTDEYTRIMYDFIDNCLKKM